MTAALPPDLHLVAEQASLLLTLSVYLLQRIFLARCRICDLVDEAESTLTDEPIDLQ